MEFGKRRIRQIQDPLIFPRQKRRSGGARVISETERKGRTGQIRSRCRGGYGGDELPTGNLRFHGDLLLTPHTGRADILRRSSVWAAITDTECAGKVRENLAPRPEIWWCLNS